MALKYETCVTCKDRAYYMGNYIQGVFFNWTSPEKVSRLPPPQKKCLNCPPPYFEKLRIFEGKNIATSGCFWPLLPTWSNFYGSKWLVHVSHIVLHVSCCSRTSGGYFRPQKLVLSKIAIFCCFWAKIEGR